MSLFAWLFEFDALSAAHRSMLLLHISTALGALTLGPVAMLARKGRERHRLWGRVYVYLMIVTNLAALVLLFWRWNTFLFGITALAFYAVVTGYRGMQRPQVQTDPKREVPSVTWFDWVFATAAAGAGALLFWLAAQNLFGAWRADSASTRGVALLVATLALTFGGFIANAVVEDVRRFVSKRRRAETPWVYHLNRMVGSYTALVTAFLVQRADIFVPDEALLVLFIAPSLLALPLIRLWERRHRHKLQPKYNVPKHLPD